MAMTGWTTYQLRRQIFSIGEDFWVQNTEGENVYKVDGKVLVLTQTFALQDANGNELARMQKEMLTLRKTMDVERDGQVVAVVKKAFFNILSQHFDIDVAGSGALEAQGDMLNHEIQITGGGQDVASVSRQWFAGAMFYGVAVAPGQDEVLLLCIGIDIQVSVDDILDDTTYVPTIESLGVQLRSRDDDQRFFRPFADRTRDVHIHVCNAGSAWERRHLLFVAYLGSDPAARDAYLKAKESATARWADDRIAYTEAKDEVIREIGTQAEAWAARTRWSVPDPAAQAGPSS